jgi:glycosyltransferase involved in cell wall biosynthesis
MHLPKISVCIPTYNYGRYISQAIESVLNQSFTDFELLVVDDSSSDLTDEILLKLSAQDSRVRYFRHETNIGMVENWNYCLREARGKYIKYLFGDDFFTSENILEQMASVLDSDDVISLVGSARKFVNSESGANEIQSFSVQNKVLDGTTAINLCITKQQNLIGEPTAVMFRKSQAVRGFDCKYRQLVDLEMWFHLLEQGRYYHFSEPLCAFRVHNEQQTAKNAKELVSMNDTYNLYSEYLCKPYITASVFFKRYFWYDYYYQVWKVYNKQHRISFSDFAERVRHYGLVRFFALYPAYKTFKPFYKIFRKYTHNTCA